MKPSVVALVLSLALAPSLACKKKEADAPKKPAVAAPAPVVAAPVAVPAPVPAPVPSPAAALPMATIAVGGSKFAPPVKPVQIAAGAWYCDMGTVEYARPDQGDGRCPTCGMKLKQKK